MNKKILSSVLFVFLLISGYVPIALAHNAPFPVDYDPTHAIVDSIGEPETLDPAWCYDTGSAEIIFNVYETLIFYLNTMTDGPYSAGKADQFKAALATDVSIISGPGAYVKTFYFKIRGMGSVHTFVPTTGVLLFDETDPEYGVAGKNKADVSEVAVPDKQYTGTGSPMDTTWIDTTPGYTLNSKWVLRSWSDADSDGKLSAIDLFDMVRECKNVPKGPWWNLREYFGTITVANPTVTASSITPKFPNGALLTPQDVEYSFERWLIQDRDGGPQWMLYYPLINDYYAYDPADDPNFDDRINNAIGSNATHAWVSLETDFPETTFLQIMSQSWASIVNKAWAVAKGDFDGNWAAGWATIYNTWHNPDESFIEGDMMGTGPYKFDYWVQGTAYSVVRNTDYWDDETAKPGEGALVSANGKERLPGSISRVTWNLITAWTTRQLRFLAGDVDYTAVPRQYRDQVLGVSVGGAPIRCFYPIEPQLAVDAEFFTFDINTASPYLGVPGGLPRGTFSQLGIPPDIFNDIHVRLGFAAAFDYNTFLTSAYLGEAVQPSDPIIVGLSYDNPAAKKPVFNMATAATELTAAWGGALWAGGMKLTLLFNEGNVARETASNMLANNIMSLNPKFHVEVQQVAWGSTYLPQMVAGMLPLFSIGWLVDYPDPDNFAFPFMHTYGTFSAWQRYSNARVDTLIENGALMPEDTAPYSGQLDVADPRPLFNNPGGMPPDTRWPRRSIYYELQALYVEDSPGFTLDQAKGRGFQQAWTRGWYYNPVYPGAYFYHRWKAKTHFGDANNDQAVGVLDSATVSGSWTKPSPTSTLGPVGYRTQADLTGGTGGTTGDASGLVVGIPDGKVSVVDSALVSAYWDGPPKGPSHTF